MQSRSKNVRISFGDQRPTSLTEPYLFMETKKMKSNRNRTDELDKFFHSKTFRTDELDDIFSLAAIEEISFNAANYIVDGTRP